MSGSSSSMPHMTGVDSGRHEEACADHHAQGSSITRSFVITEGPAHLMGASGIAPRGEGASAQDVLMGDDPTGYGSSQDSPRQASPPISPMRVRLPRFAAQDDLPEGSPISRASSGLFANRPTVPDSASTASPSDLSSPEPGLVHAMTESPRPDDPASDPASPAKASDGDSPDVHTRPLHDSFDTFSIGAVHTQGHSPAKRDAVLWRSGIPALDSTSKSGPTSQIPSPGFDSLAGLDSLDVGSPTRGGSPSKAQLLPSAAKTPWTVFQTPSPGRSEGPMLSSSTYDPSGGKTGDSNPCPRGSIYATPAATGMSSISKTTGGQTPQARRFATGLEGKQQGAQWRDLFDGYDSEASPGMTSHVADSPASPKARSVLDSPGPGLSAKEASPASWAGFNPFYAQS